MQRQVAASVGQVFAFALGFLGLFGNPLLIFIAIFVYIAAGGEAQMSAFNEAARRLSVGDAARAARICRPSELTGCLRTNEALHHVPKKLLDIFDAASRQRVEHLSPNGTSQMITFAISGASRLNGHDALLLQPRAGWTSVLINTVG